MRRYIMLLRHFPWVLNYPGFSDHFIVIAEFTTSRENQRSQTSFA